MVNVAATVVTGVQERVNAHRMKHVLVPGGCLSETLMLARRRFQHEVCTNSQSVDRNKQ